jgi:hypothetical protein
MKVLARKYKKGLPYDALLSEPPKADLRFAEGHPIAKGARCLGALQLGAQGPILQNSVSAEKNFTLK